MGSPAGKTVAITGAARGIGYATARELLTRGARVVIGDRDVIALKSAVDGLSKFGPVSGHPLDVTDRRSFEKFLSNARRDGGGQIDVLINNAGVMPIGHFVEQSAESIRSAVDVNLGGVVTGCQLVLAEMKARRSGHIINVASLAGVMAVPGQVVYAATKFAVVGLSTALADEVADDGITVTAVMPPFTKTELISGTSGRSADAAVEPEIIAQAIAKALEKPTTYVSVPGAARWVLTLISLLPPRGRRFIHRRSGTDRMFLDFDASARRSYAGRAEVAQGIIESHHG